MGAFRVRSAFLRKVGRKYTAVLKYLDGDKVRQRTRVLKARTRSDAMRELEAFRAEFEGSGPPVEVQAHVRAYIASLDVEASTRSVYSYLLGYYEGLGLVGDLSPSKVKNWMDGLTTRGLSSSTVLKAYRLLKQALDKAVGDGLIDSNPCKTVKPPRNIRKPPNALDARGRSRLLMLLGDMEPSPFRLAVYIALCTGMRRGEICALRWDDVDLERCEIHVGQSMGIARGGAYQKPPKTLSSIRTIPIPSLLEEQLRTPHNGPYVLGDRPYSPARLTKEWQSFARTFGIKGHDGICTFHDLRHTYATMAIAGGADIRSVASILGHSSVAMTLDVYAAPDEQAKRRAADLIGAELEKGSTPKDAPRSSAGGKE